MKKIEAIIRTTKFDAVQDALASIGVKFFTLTEVRGYGLQTGGKRIYRGADLGANFIPRLQMDVVTTEDKVVIDGMQSVATGMLVNPVITEYKSQTEEQG